MPDSSSARLACALVIASALGGARAEAAGVDAAAGVAAPAAETVETVEDAPSGSVADGALPSTTNGAAATSSEGLSEVAEVEVSVLGDNGPPIAEAVLRIRAELRAVGFDVRLAQDSAATELGAREGVRRKVGAIVLVRSGGSVQILAQAADGAPLTQQVDLTRASITAEVLAVRAVEAFRAALLQTMRDRSAPPESMTDAVRAFTQSNEHLARPVTRAPPRRSPEPAPRPRAQVEESPWLLTAGPLVLAPSLGVSVTAGAEAQLARALGPVLVGVLVDGSISPARWSTKTGTVEGSQRSLLATAAAALPCPPRFVCQLGATLGPRWSSFVALPDDPSAPAETAGHRSLLAEGSALVGYFFDEHAGIVGRARVGALLDAPAMTAADDEALSWGRPAWGASLCAALRF